MMINGEPYLYVTNQQGDVTMVTDRSGLPLCSYTYDAWGNVLSITGENTEIGELNPIRYRGYYQDVETGLYYLQSRYYDPATMRFINADDPNVIQMETEEKQELNLYVYCVNDPENGVDPTGYIAVRVIVSAAIGGVVGGLLEVVLQYIQGRRIDNLNWSSVVIEFLNGAITGALIGLGLSPSFTRFGRALINMVTSIAHSIQKKAGFWKTIGAALFSGLSTYVFSSSKFAKGKSLITRTTVNSIVKSIQTRLSRFTIRVLWWKITISI